VTTTPHNEVYAIKYAELLTGHRREYFYGGTESRGDEPMPLSYYVWLVRDADHVVLVDTGFAERTATTRSRRWLRSPPDSLRRLGIEPAEVTDVVLTHLHYDHVGATSDYPRARFVVQDAEMAFWTGRSLPRTQYGRLIETEDLADLVRLNHAGRLHFVDGVEEIRPGVAVRLVGGHTKGLQIVVVDTADDRVVLASDAAHFWENIDTDTPFGVVHDVSDMYRAFDTIRALVSAPDRVIPGHDPLVAERFPAVDGDDLIVRIA